jgi:hypothetical protein
VTRSLLVYDGSAEPLRAAARAFERASEGVRLVRWESEPVQAFLRAQFDEAPFALLLVEGDSVHVGDAAVERILEREGTPEALADLVATVYPTVAGPFGRLVHGREPADRHETVRLTDAAREHLRPLRESHEIPVEEA